MVEARSKSPYISKIKEGTWWSQIKNKSICPNPKKGMVEGRRKVSYMPKQGKRHGGAKQLFTKYAQHKVRICWRTTKKSGFYKNPDSLVFTCIHFCLIWRLSWARGLSRVLRTASGLALDSPLAPWWIGNQARNEIPCYRTDSVVVGLVCGTGKQE